MSIIKEKRIVNTPDNTPIHIYVWKNNEKKPKKIIIICHGMAEHIERYDEFSQKLALDNIVIGYNQRGHKDTSTKDNYGYMGEDNNFLALVNDLKYIVGITKKEYNIPIYIFGHSMGSFVTTRYAQLDGRDIEGIILSGSGRNSNLILGLGSTVASVISLFKGRKYRSKLMDSLSFGSFNKAFKPNRTSFDWLNTDENEVDKYINDEYCGGIFTVAYFKDFLKECIKINKQINNIPDIKTLIVSGTDDPVGNMTKGTDKLYNSLIKTNHSKVTLKYFSKARHEILLEKNKEEIHDYIIGWINKN